MFTSSPQANLKWKSNRSHQTAFLEGSAEIRMFTDHIKMLCPEEIEQINSIMEQIVEVLEEAFFNPFSQNLDKKSFTILSR